MATLPHFKRTDHLGPLVIPLHGLHAMALEFAEKTFRERGECAPHFLIAVGTDVLWMEDSWSSADERHAKFRAYRKMFRIIRARAYSFISEVYMRTIPKDADPKAEMRKSLEHMPRSERDEFLWVTSFDLDDVEYNSRFLITPRKNRMNLLGPRIDEQYADGLYGPAANLLREERKIDEVNFDRPGR